MSATPALSVAVAADARVRLAAARAFVEACPPAGEVLVVGASREAADELVREISAAKGATFGLHRFGLWQLAARAASLELARGGLAPATRLGAEAVAARVTFDAREADALAYVAPVAGFRGFPRALAATLADLRLGAVAPAALEALGTAGRDLRELAGRFDAELARARIADRAALLAAAVRAVRSGRAGLPVDRPLVLLDVAVESSAEAAFLAALVAAAPRALATVPAGDERTLAALGALGGAAVAVRAEAEKEDGEPDLARLRRNLFALDDSSYVVPGFSPASTTYEAAGITFFSAPGEGREAVEVVRRVLEEAGRGVRFDDMAIVLRAPLAYAGLLESALARAGVPAWFARGTASPHPAGRAFLALLACAAEGLSARRFAEYVSLGQVPVPDEAGGPPAAAAAWVPADTDEQPLPASAETAVAPAPGQLSLFGAPDSDVAQGFSPARQAGLKASPAYESYGVPGFSPAPPDSDAAPVLEGTLRAPWKWDHLLVESSVIGGGRQRWARRLDGLAEELARKRDEAAREEPDSPRVRAYVRDIRDLDHLRRFALPVIDALVALPVRAAWGAWLDALDRLAPMVLRRPDRVLAVLAELRPMAAVGPVTLEEVQHVLAERLAVTREEPPKRRYGRVFVATPDQLRGRCFRVVFVPGLAERIFPQRARQDPLLLDDLRRSLPGAPSGPAGGAPALPLPTREDRAAAERALLRLAAGAASERLHLSYPRMDLTESRPRVPSFYALDVERALTGRVPDFKELEDQAFAEAGARLAWPAPPDPARAIDDTEHDLAVLGRLLRLERPADAKGRARYLFELNPTLRRSLLRRFARWQKKWSAADGLYKPGSEALAALERDRLTARAYSVSALQKFAVCPYQFLLGAVHRLEPRKEIVPLEKMDPLTRGSIFHKVQAELMRALKKARRLPVVARDLREAQRLLDETLDRVAAEEKDVLAPAIDRVWRDEIESMRADLRGWLQRVADEGGEWTPIHAELGFGFPPGEGRDPASVEADAVVDTRWRLHGYVDLIEEKTVLGTRDSEGAARRGGVTSSSSEPGVPSTAGNALRITDHKTGRARAGEGFIVGGGEHLQPVLYGMAVEQALGRSVELARLFYCTAAGGFAERAVPLGPMERRHGLEVLEIIDRAVGQGCLTPVPRDGACRWCDFREVCGPNEERRAARKPRIGATDDLEALRKLP